ncbi:hypothetical protein [Streptomyces sp. NPDC050485]|uniref:hypothetical protein n=1 Tax=Streptomyces sp. NPDC050485 TaxID=3365617 RepID=UPI0037A4A1DD
MAGESTEREQGPGPEQAAEPAAPASATWLKGQLLKIASALYPDRGPVVVREWSDPVQLFEPEPVGHRHLLLVAVGGDDRPAHPDFDEVLDAFRAAGWTALGSGSGSPQESWATARSEDFEVRVYEGEGPGILTFTGWTPVVFTEPGHRQPHFTRSTADGVLCSECHGWGVCMDCRGSGRGSGTGSAFGAHRCWCSGGRGGAGSCIDCGGSGSITSRAEPWKRKQFRFPDPGGADAVRQPPVEDGRLSAIDALADIAHRACSCGEFRSLWRNTLAEADDRIVARFVGSCRGCGAERAYAFTLPHRKLPAPPAPPAPPPCPRCAGAPVPLVGGLSLPGSAALRAQELGLVAASSSGCEVRPDEPNWRCASCGHDWRDADLRRRDRILRSILAGVPAS